MDVSRRNVVTLHRVGVHLTEMDNAMCESFFATLECELLDRRRFRTKAEARMAIFEFIEAWYNPKRRHSSLGYKSPVDFENQYLEKNQKTKSLTVH